MPVDDRDRRAAQVAGAGVVAEARPERHDVVIAGRRQRAQVREARRKRAKYGRTVATTVCCSMNSETSVLYGLGSARHGRSRCAPVVPAQQRARERGHRNATMTAARISAKETR